MKPRVAIVIPAFNEERNLGHVLEEIFRLQDARPRWEVIPIVVNDGSTDTTALVLERLYRQYSALGRTICYLNLPINVGIGRTVQAGFQQAMELGADVTLQLDGDGQHPPFEVPKLVGAILANQADVVVGSRYVKGAGGNVSSRTRELGTRLLSTLVSWIAGVKILDVTSGFRAFNRDATDFLSRYYPDDYPEVQAYVPLARKKFVLKEVPVNMKPRLRGHSSITPLRSGYYMIKVAFAASIDRVRSLPARRYLGARLALQKNAQILPLEPKTSKLTGQKKVVGDG